MTTKPKRMPKKIFSGSHSVPMWKGVNAIKVPGAFTPFNVWQAIYVLGCYCQELEDKLDRIAK